MADKGWRVFTADDGVPNPIAVIDTLRAKTVADNLEAGDAILIAAAPDLLAALESAPTLLLLGSHEGREWCKVRAAALARVKP